MVNMDEHCTFGYLYSSTQYTIIPQSAKHYIPYMAVILYGETLSNYNLCTFGLGLLIWFQLREILILQYILIV